MNKLARRLALVSCLVALGVLVNAADAFATHFRYGTITWQVANPATPNVITVRFDSAWRRSFFSAPVVGSKVSLGTMRVLRTNGTQIAGASLNPIVTSVFAADDWIATTWTTTITLPAVTEDYILDFSSCCRISTLRDGNDDRDFKVSSVVTVRMPPLAVNRPPTAVSQPIIFLPLNQPATFQVPAFDPDGDPLVYSLAPTGTNVLTGASGMVKNAPTGFMLSPTGQATWTPTTAGLYSVQFHITDDKGARTALDVLLNVVSGASVGSPPVITIDGTAATASFNVITGNALSFTVEATDPDNGVVTLLANGLPSGPSMNPTLPTSGNSSVSSVFSWTPTSADVGSYLVSFGALDDQGLQGTQLAQITVSNNPPTVVCLASGGTIEATGPGGGPFSVQASVDDADGDPLTVRTFVDGLEVDLQSAGSLPAVVTYAGTAALGPHTFEVRVADGVSTGASCTGAFDIVDRTAPSLNLPGDDSVAGTASAGGAVYSFTASAVDLVDPNPVVSCLPASGSLFPFGTTIVQCTATDASGNQNQASFDVVVIDPTPPLVEPTVTGSLGDNGWYTSDVTVSFAVGDPETGIDSSTGCDAAIITTDTAGTTYTCSATNGSGGTASASVTVKRDATAPVLSTSGNLLVAAVDASGAPVSYAAPTAADAMSGLAGPATCAPASGTQFALGTTTVACLVRDAAGLLTSAGFDVTVADQTAPVIGSVAPSVGLLWPPNHKMIAIDILAVATDNVTAAPVCTITGATSSEADNGLGDGDTAGDVVISGPLSVSLRAERSGRGPGRAYTIEVTCTDEAGNPSVGSTVVGVPKSMGRGGK